MSMCKFPIFYCSLILPAFKECHTFYFSIFYFKLCGSQTSSKSKTLLKYINIIDYLNAFINECNTRQLFTNE